MVGRDAGKTRRPYVPILVAALGYFVDIYDLILFSIVRVPSLTALGLSGDALLESGVLLLNMQMAGMLVGGIAWGVMGDRRGRLSVLFGSIVLYSVASVTPAPSSPARPTPAMKRSAMYVGTSATKPFAMFASE